MLRRWWLTVPVVVAVVYLLFVVGPFYANGMFRFALADFDREGMQAGDFLPYSAARPLWSVLWVVILPAAIAGWAILPGAAASWAAASYWTKWPTDAKRERWASILLGGILLVLACTLYFANMRKIIAWFVGD